MIDRITGLARMAGKRIMEVYSRPFTVEYKDDSSPLTEADKASHAVIEAGLRQIAPDLPVISEEGEEVPFSIRKGFRSFWLVDPLDGTKEFIKRNGEFTVNIALIEDTVPVLGVIYAPAKGLMYFARRGKGAYREDAGGSRRIQAAHLRPGASIKAVVSRSHPSPAIEEYLGAFTVESRVEAGSSLKFCLVAEGTADIYPRFGETWEWDTAAGHAIAAEAGALVTLPDLAPLTYNKEGLKNPGFIAASQGMRLKPYLTPRLRKTL
ncbi:MAG TPA: 3'(2'),5'-bisphosphate nucleotidase CysQ [Thermodesulfobacteriota bacterium]